MMQNRMYQMNNQNNQMPAQPIQSNMPQDPNAPKPITPPQPNPQTPMQPPMNNMNNMNMMRYPFPYMRPMWGGYPNMMNPQMAHPQMPMSNPQMATPVQPQVTTPPPTTTANEVKDVLTEVLRELKKSSNDKGTGNSNTSSNREDDLSSIKSEADINFEKEYSLEEENLKNIWSGFLTKNKKDRISVDVYQIRGNIDEYFNSEGYLNVSHKTNYDEMMKRQILGIIAISPQNVTQCEIFQDYLSYFNERQRVGVINFKSKYILYIMPPCEFSRKFYQNPKKHLLGILVDSTTEPKAYVDMSNLNLPPPVISTTEKKLLTKMQKKNQNANTAVNK